VRVRARWAQEEEEEEEDEFVFGDLSFFPRVVKGGAELPEGWRVRQATTAGAYGSAKWNPRDVREQSEVVSGARGSGVRPRTGGAAVPR
jgi:hypothetical protein